MIRWHSFPMIRKTLVVSKTLAMVVLEIFFSESLFWSGLDHFADKLSGPLTQGWFFRKNLYLQKRSYHRTFIKSLNARHDFSIISLFQLFETFRKKITIDSLSQSWFSNFLFEYKNNLTYHHIQEDLSPTGVYIR